MYLFSRVIHGLASVLWNNLNSPPLEQSPQGGLFKFEAAAVWGLVMWLFYNHRKSLQSSLQASMQYLYHDSDGLFENLTQFFFASK
jgi:peroxisomal membrane protein 4